MIRFIMAGCRKQDSIPVEQVVHEIDANDVSLGGPSDESGRDEVYDLCWS
jgi:hypothetical protein